MKTSLMDTMCKMNYTCLLPACVTGFSRLSQFSVPVRVVLLPALCPWHPKLKSFRTSEWNGMAVEPTDQSDVRTHWWATSLHVCPHLVPICRWILTYHRLSGAVKLPPVFSCPPVRSYLWELRMTVQSWTESWCCEGGWSKYLIDKIWQSSTTHWQWRTFHIITWPKGARD
jgi:hypothetical protein